MTLIQKIKSWLFKTDYVAVRNQCGSFCIEPVTRVNVIPCLYINHYNTTVYIPLVEKYIYYEGCDNRTWDPITPRITKYYNSLFKKN